MKNIATHLGSWIGLHPRTTAKRAGSWMFTLVVAAMLAGQAVGQTTNTWTQLAVGSQDWTAGVNWANTTVFVSGAGNELRFFPDATATWRMPVGTLTITNVQTSLSMNTLTLNGQGPNSTSSAFLIVGDNSSTWTVGDGSTAVINLTSGSGGGHPTGCDIVYTVAPNITITNAVTTFTGGGFSILGYNFSGNISESAAGCGITKSGTSRLTFSGTNTYSGTTTVNGGQLRLNSANALPGGIGATGGTSALTINSGGIVGLGASDFLRNLGAGSDQFQITGGTSGFSAFGAPRFVIVNGDPSQELVWGNVSFAPSTLILNAATANNALWLANKINLNAATRTVQVDANTAILAGDIRTSSGTAGITKTGNGTLILSGTNTYNGNTTITAGTLSVGASANLGSTGSLIMNGGTLQITGTALTSVSGFGRTLTYSAAANTFDIHNFANSFTVDQVLTGTTFTKSGAGTLVLNKANTFTGATTLSAGTLVLDYGSGQDNSKISSTAALTLSGGNLVLRGGSHPQAVSATTVTGNTGNTISRDGGSSATIDLKAINVGGLSALNISEESIAKTTATTVNGILGGGAITVGSHFATTNASGIVTNSAYTSYSSGPGGGNLTTVNQWTGGGTLSSGLQSYALRISNNGNSEVLNIGANSFTVPNGGTILYAGGGDNNFTVNGTGRFTTINGNQPLHVAIYAGTLTMNGSLTSGGANPLAKSGAGTLVAAGANTYSGTTYVEQGALRLANNTAAGTTGGGIIVQGGAALELTNSITVGAEVLTISGTGISNGGALRNLSGNNTYGGGVTIGGGGARINSDSGTLTLSGGIVTTGGQDLSFGSAGNITVSTNGIRGAANLIKDGAGTLELVITDSAVQSSCGDMTLNASTLQLTFNVAPSTTVSPIKIMGNLTFSGTPTIKIAGVVPNGVLYPLLTVAGSAPTSVPNLELASGIIGTLKWVGKTLYLTPSPAGSVILFK